VLQCVAVRCSVLQRDVVCCNVLQCVAVAVMVIVVVVVMVIVCRSLFSRICCSVMQYDAVCFSVFSACFIVFQCVKVYCFAAPRQGR